MRSKTGKVAGVLIIVIGTLALLDNLFGGFDFWNFLWKLWPVVLIVLGVYILKSRRSDGGDVNSTVSLSDSTLLGDLDISLSGEEVNGRHFSTLIGDMRIDLANSDFIPGENRIGIFSLIGDIILRIPVGIPVRLSSRSLIGDIRFDDLRRNGFFQRLDHSDEKYQTAERKILLSVDCLIGDLNVNRIKIDDVN